MNKMTPKKHLTPNYKIDRCGHWEAVPLRATRKDLPRVEIKPMRTHRPGRPFLMFAALAAAMAMGR